MYVRIHVLSNAPTSSSFGYNWSQPTESPRVPYLYWTTEQLGSRIGGQMSAAITSMRMQPTDG